MGASEKTILKVRCLALALVLWAIPSLAGAQDAVSPREPPPGPVVVDPGEIDALLDSIQTRVDAMNASAKDSDAAMAFLSNQVEAAIRKLSSQETETGELREITWGLSSELQAVAATRDGLDFEVARLSEEKDAIFARLQGQVRDLASLLSLEREVTTNLRESLDGRTGDLRASLAERKRTAGELGRARDALTAQQAASERQVQRMAAIESDIADLRDGRDALKDELSTTDGRNDALTEKLAVTHSQIEALNRQLTALREQIAGLNDLLKTSDGQSKGQQAEIADLGRRLNLALATKVRELARYRSEFLGRLREVLGERADVRVVGDRFVFQSEVLFGSGEAELEAAGRAQLMRLGDSLKEIGATIPADIDWVLRIDGHTDERPIQTERFPSNWELSTARAISVVRFLIGQGVPAERVMAAGFAHFRPLDPGGGEAAFRRNRRIEFRLTQK